MWVRHHNALEAPGLRTALVLGHQPASGQDVGVVAIGRLGWRPVQHPEEFRSAVRGGEAILEHPWGAWMVDVGTGPEHPFLLFDALVADARVVGDATGAGEPQ